MKCQKCKIEKEIVGETYVCLECLLEMSSHWDFCNTHLRYFRKDEECLGCCPGLLVVP
jgi:hypothetical protein